MTGDAITPREPVTVDIGNVHSRQMVMGLMVAGAFGVIAVVSSITGHVDGGTGTRVAAFVLGLVFSVIGLLPLLMWRVAFRPQRLVFDAGGVRWDDPDGRPWSVTWPELGEVTFFHPGPDTGGPTPPPAMALQLRPAGPAFRADHPELEHLAVDTGGPEGVVYRLPLGHAQSTAGTIDEALRAFASRLYRPAGPRIPVPPARPRAVEVSVGILACSWAAIIGSSAVMGQISDLKTAAIMVFWTLVAGLWFRRIWLGGPAAIGRMIQFATPIGVVILAGMAALAYLRYTSPVMGLQPADLWRFVPGVAAGGVLLLVSRLLAREDVKRWYTGRGLGR